MPPNGAALGPVEHHDSHNGAHRPRPLASSRCRRQLHHVGRKRTSRSRRLIRSMADRGNHLAHEQCTSRRALSAKRLPLTRPTTPVSPVFSSLVDGANQRRGGHHRTVRAGGRIPEGVANGAHILTSTSPRRRQPATRPFRLLSRSTSQTPTSSRTRCSATGFTSRNQHRVPASTNARWSWN